MGGELLVPDEMLSMRVVKERLERDRSGEKKLSFEQLHEILLFTEELFHDYNGKPTEWNLIYPDVSLKDFLKEMGEFFSAKANQKYFLEDDEKKHTPVTLLGFNWFTAFRSASRDTAEIPKAADNL